MKTIVNFLDHSLRRFPNKPIYHLSPTSVITYEQFGKEISKFQCLLQRNKINKGDVCIVVGDNSPKLGALFCAMFKEGCIVVPTYLKQHQDIKMHMIREIQPKIIFNSGASLKNNIPLSNIIELNHETVQIDASHHNFQNHILEPNDVATILYTSGTSGTPKGVMLTHENIVSNIVSINEKFGSSLSNLTEEDVCVSFLPMNHCYGLVCEYLYMLYKGASMHINTDLTKLVLDFRTYNPTILCAVPRLFQMIYKGIPIKNTEYLPFGSYINNFLKEKTFGKRIRHATCGGAAIDSQLLKYFHTMDLPIYQGYGSTETSPMVTLNAGTENIYGSVGKVLECNQIKFVNDEIWVSGSNVSRGYFKHTSDSFVLDSSDNKYWYKTGDTGHMENEYLFIDGRLSETYKLSNGKFVNPAEIEGILGRLRCVKQSIVFSLDGDQNMALIVSDESVDKVNMEIKKLKLHIKGYEFPTKIVVIKENFDQELLTQKQSLKRKQILEKYMNKILNA
jgi:long-chain acyl-CoA synthetase